MRSHLHCRVDHCRAEILFVALPERPGRTACLDAAPVDPVDALHRTRLVQVSQTSLGLTAVVLSGAHLTRAITTGETLFDFHSETCLSARNRRPTPDRVGAGPVRVGQTSQELKLLTCSVACITIEPSRPGGSFGGRSADADSLGPVGGSRNSVKEVGTRMTTHNALRRSLAGVAALALVGVTAACGSGSSGGTSAGSKSGPITIGVPLGLTGPAAPTAAWARMGVQLAEAQINKNGGVNGRQIKLNIVDTALDPTKAVTAVQRMVSQDHVNFIVGPMTSDESLATLPIMTQAKVANINGSGSAITPKVAPLGFAMLPNAEAQAQRMVEIANKDYGAKRVAVLHYSGTQGKVAGAAMDAALKKLGSDPVADQEYNAQSTDLTPQLLEIQKSNPDVILAFTQTGTDTGRVVLGLRQLKSKVPVIGSYASTFAAQTEGVAGQDAFKNLKSVTWSAFSACDKSSISPAVTDFLTNVKEMFGTDPAYKSAALDYTAIWRDSVYLLAGAVKATGSTDGGVIANWLETEGAGAAKSMNLVHKGFAMSKSNHFLMDTSSLVLTDPGQQIAPNIFKRATC